jgi:nicotinamide-nucleotide amidase
MTLSPAEVIAIGDEITSGQALDTNSQWLSQRLEGLGIRVLYHTTVGDELQPNVQVFRQAIQRAQLVVATGGLGPTADDLTRQALAEATGQTLVQDAEALEQIRALFARRKRPMPPQNEVQALLPAGSRRIDNPHGTAPGIAIEVPRPGQPPCRFFVLPGVPAEMKEMWQASIDPQLRQAGAGRRIVIRRNLCCFGAGESQIESLLPDLIRRGRTPTVGITASQATITLRVSAEAESAGQCQELLGPTIATIRKCLGSLVFGEEHDQLQDVVLRLLRDRGATLATAECGTAGLVANWLGDSAESPGPFLGGLVVPAGAALAKCIPASDETIARVGPASSQVAAALAEHCRVEFGADYGLAVSGFPPFDPAAAEPGLVHFSVATREGTRVKSQPFAAHPALLRVLSGKQALNMLRLILLDGAHRG